MTALTQEQAIAVSRHVRESQGAADRLLKRAQHLEKRAARSPAGSNERRKLNAQAGVARANAELLLVEVSEGSARLRETAA